MSTDAPERIIGTSNLVPNLFSNAVGPSAIPQVTVACRHTIPTFIRLDTLYGRFSLPLRVVQIDEVYSCHDSTSDLHAFANSLESRVKILSGICPGRRKLCKQDIVSDVSFVFMGWL